MKSPRGFLGALVFLLAIPSALLYRAVSGGDPEPVLHFLFAVGAGLLALSHGGKQGGGRPHLTDRGTVA